MSNTQASQFSLFFRKFWWWNILITVLLFASYNVTMSSLRNPLVNKSLLYIGIILSIVSIGQLLLFLVMFFIKISQKLWLECFIIIIHLIIVILLTKFVFSVFYLGIFTLK